MPNIIEITDFAAPELDIYARLTEGQLLNRHEPDKGIFIAESPKVISRALDAGLQGHRTRPGRGLRSHFHADGDETRGEPGPKDHQALR